MSSVSKRDHAPPTGQTPGKKASKRRAVSRNSKKSLFQDEEPKPDVKVQYCFLRLWADSFCL